MSDTEDVQAASKRRMSDSSSASSADDDSSSMAKKELDNSGFRVDGEPMNKPRKVSPHTLFYHIYHQSRSDNFQKISNWKTELNSIFELEIILIYYSMRPLVRSDKVHFKLIFLPDK